MPFKNMSVFVALKYCKIFLTKIFTNHFIYKKVQK